MNVVRGKRRPDRAGTRSTRPVERRASRDERRRARCRQAPCRQTCAERHRAERHERRGAKPETMRGGSCERSRACSRARAARSIREKTSEPNAGPSLLHRNGEQSSGSRRWSDVRDVLARTRNDLPATAAIESTGRGPRAGGVPARGSFIVTKASEVGGVVGTRVGIGSTGHAQPRAAPCPLRRGRCR